MRVVSSKIAIFTARRVGHWDAEENQTDKRKRRLGKD